jgi:D-alanyl-D-alanine carboxypeptidase
VSEDGELVRRVCLLENTNRLLAEGCLGGKTGCNLEGGDSFVGCFDGGIMVAVLGCAGRTEKFKDCMRLVEWVQYKLSISQEQAN